MMSPSKGGDPRGQRLLGAGTSAHRRQDNVLSLLPEKFLVKRVFSSLDEVGQWWGLGSAPPDFPEVVEES